MSLDNILDEQDDAFKEHDVEENTFTPLPDGKYQVGIEQVAFAQSKVKKKWQLSWTMAVLTGNYSGRTVWMNTPLEGTYKDSDGNQRPLIGISKNSIYACGIEVPDTKSLKKTINSQALVGKTVEIQLKTKGDNQNVRILREIEGVAKFTPDEATGDEPEKAPWKD